MNLQKLFAAGNKVKAGQLGAIEVILNVMKMHIDNVGVCEKGCVGLWNIMSNGKPTIIKKTGI